MNNRVVSVDPTSILWLKKTKSVYGLWLKGLCWYLVIQFYTFCYFQVSNKLLLSERKEINMLILFITFLKLSVLLQSPTASTLPRHFPQPLTIKSIQTVYIHWCTNNLLLILFPLRMLLTICFCLFNSCPCSSFGFLNFLSPCVYSSLGSYKVKKASVGYLITYSRDC